MPFLKHTETLFDQINNLLQQLSEDAFKEKLPILHSSSIGQHLRHVIEFFEELEKGYHTGVVNYDNRQRSLLLETDKTYAAVCMARLASGLNKNEKVLQLAVNYEAESAETTTVATSYYREWVYNIEHTVHHMALIKLGIQQLDQVTLPDSFGTAVSTQRAKQVCVQ
jgi:hypothetical protein